ncbi:MAG: HEPN domain-containing protein [Chitinophagaceae bacterium]|nr:HEPN domain-containing protein [Chitinophagaceae bacterium]
MTEKNKAINMMQELEKGKDCLKSADLLAVNGQLADAVSRLYYYVYHYMRALLLSKSLEPKTHEGILRVLGMHFIKPQILPTTVAHAFARLMKYREEADYSPLYFVTEDDYSEFKKDAVFLSTTIEAYLKDNGYI